MRRIKLWLLVLSLLLAIIGSTHAQDNLETITLSVEGMV